MLAVIKKPMGVGGLLKYVAGFMFSEDDKDVLLIEKQSPAWQRGFLNAVGGKVEPGEEPLEAMTREFREETGVNTESSAWYHFVTVQSGTAQVEFFFTHSNLLYEAQTVELEKVVCCRVAQLPANILPNLKWLVPLASDKTLSFKRAVLLTETVHLKRG